MWDMEVPESTTKKNHNIMKISEKDIANKTCQIMRSTYYLCKLKFLINFAKHFVFLTFPACF